MISSKDLIGNIFKEMNITRISTSDNPSFLNKKELKDILCFVVTLKQRNSELKMKLSDTKAIVNEVIQASK